MNKRLGTLIPLIIAGLFMLAGTMFLVWLGRDQSRILNQAMGPLDLRPLLASHAEVEPEAWRKHVLVLHFWGTWCGPCREEYPEFASLYSRLKNDDRLLFISVSCSAGMESDLEQLRAETREYLQSIGVEMPVYADSAAFTRGHIARLLASQGMGYPTTLVIDRQGIIRDAWIGMANMAQLESAILRIASEPTAGR